MGRNIGPIKENNTCRITKKYTKIRTKKYISIYIKFTTIAAFILLLV